MMNDNPSAAIIVIDHHIERLVRQIETWVTGPARSAEWNNQIELLKSLRVEIKEAEDRESQTSEDLENGGMK